MEYKEGEVIVATPCDHVFHKRCCQEWFQLSRTCPVCRLDGEWPCFIVSLFIWCTRTYTEYTVPEALGMDPTVDSSHSTGTMRRGEMNMPNFIRIIRREQRNEEPEMLMWLLSYQPTTHPKLRIKCSSWMSDQCLVKYRTLEIMLMLK